MISQMIWCFALLGVLVRSNEIGNYYNKNQINLQVTENEKLKNISFVVKRSEERTKELKIIKRGIVLVDEDFDVPSAIYAHENNSKAEVNLSTDVFGKNEGSGNVFDEKELNNTTKHEILTHTLSFKESTSTAPTKEVKLIVTTDITPSNDLESSGDDILINTNEYSVTEMLTTPQTKLVHDFYNEIPDVCMDYCSQDDLFLSLSVSKSLIPEGTNLTFSCKSNHSDHNMLYWYKSNGTIYFLQAFGADKELHLNIPDTKPVHSGIYKCVKWVNRQTCCNLKLHISVYEIPLYKYHYVILGLIAAAGFIICIILSVRQTKTLRTYTKQFVEKHGGAKQQLL